MGGQRWALLLPPPAPVWVGPDPPACNSVISRRGTCLRPRGGAGQMPVDGTPSSWSSIQHARVGTGGSSAQEGCCRDCLVPPGRPCLGWGWALDSVGPPPVGADCRLGVSTASLVGPNTALRARSQLQPHSRGQGSSVPPCSQRLRNSVLSLTHGARTGEASRRCMWQLGRAMGRGFTLGPPCSVPC